MLSSEDKILIKTCRNLTDFHHFMPKDSSRNTLTNTEKINTGRLSTKVVHNQFYRTHYRKPLATVIAKCIYSLPLPQLKSWRCS